MSFMAMFELYRRSTIGMCLTETLDEWFQLGSLAVKLLSKCLFSLTRSLLSSLTKIILLIVSINIINIICESPFLVLVVVVNG
ncbi:putative transcription initiation factor IIA, gamma subunit [Helianthus debilis subsp. tardiflorus]